MITAIVTWFYSLSIYLQVGVGLSAMGGVILVLIVLNNLALRFWQGVLRNMREKKRIEELQKQF